jgi:hypothetical protein
MFSGDWLDVNWFVMFIFGDEGFDLVFCADGLAGEVV